MTKVYRGADCELFGLGLPPPGGTYSNILPPMTLTLSAVVKAAISVRGIAEYHEQIRRNYISAVWGSSSMLGRRFAYDSRDWSRLEAWEHLTAQHIPGAPMVAPNICRVPWRKAHNEARHEWAWIYVG